jgi:hypothetical protein
MTEKRIETEPVQVTVVVPVVEKEKEGKYGLRALLPRGVLSNSNK